METECFFWDEFSVLKNNIENVIRNHWIQIDKYSINEDGSIDVSGSVEFSKSMSFLKELPLCFNKVSGDFDCSRLSLKTLIGSPTEVGGTFNCAYNQLTSLEYLPQKANCLVLDNTLKCFYTGGLNCNFNEVLILFRTNDPKLIGISDILSKNEVLMPVIFKYQNYYNLWNEDETLNQENFDELIEDIIDGLE